MAVEDQEAEVELVLAEAKPAVEEMAQGLLTSSW